MLVTTRREFLEQSLLAGTAALGAGLLGPRWALAQEVEKAANPLKILILGGTAFLGPELVAAAKARGHALTLFNRGKTRPHLFPDLEKLRGDRDPKKEEGLKALEGRKWDVVIDTSGYYPRMVKASADLLAPNVRQYVFISTISVYADNSKPGSDEASGLATMPDPTSESMGPNLEYYGALKALCEQAVEKALPGKTTLVRPGFIVGPGDWTGRFNYWPLRVEQGGEMLAPGTPQDPIQYIDVRDLAEWIIQLVEKNVAGVFNATGPERKFTMGELLEACRKVTGADTKFVWVSAQWLQEQGGEQGIDLPIWMPPTGESAGFHAWSNARAIKAGLKFRPLEDTLRDLLKWYKALPPEQQAKFRAGISPEKEKELLLAWKSAKPMAAS